MRGPSIGARAPGELRILVLGDSFVFGHGVADEETIPARLQARLGAELDSPVMVGNAGVAGHGTRDMSSSLARHEDFRPDLVVAITYLGNDFLDDCRRTSATVEGYLLHGAKARAARNDLRFRASLQFRTLYVVERWLMRHLPTLAMDLSQVQASEEEAKALARFPPAHQRFAGLFYDRCADDALVNWITESCRGNYEALAEAAAGLPILHVLMPTWWHLDTTNWRDSIARQGLDPEQHEQGAAQRRLLQIAEDSRLTMIDLTPRLAAEPEGERLWLSEDRHLSAAGCDAVASWLVPGVRRLLGR
jgi:lysophospholipase L1-like esterase